MTASPWVEYNNKKFTIRNGKEMEPFPQFHSKPRTTLSWPTGNMANMSELTSSFNSLS